MAHFYASIQGNRGEATRTGTKTSGIEGHIKGWSVGARVIVTYNEKTQKDEVKVYKTAGSSWSGSSELIAEFTN